MSSRPTIRSLIQTFIAPGTWVHTDEYATYHPLKSWDLIIIQTVIVGANACVMKTAMVSMRFM
jgi:hypothetical protein